MAIKTAPKKKPEVDTEEPEGQEPEGQEPEGQEPETGEDENKRINAIVTNRIKREMKAMQTSMAKMIEEQFAKLGPKKDDEPEDDEPEVDEPETPTKKPAAATQDPKVSKQLTRLSKELAEQKARAEKAERERAEESEKAKRNEMRSTFATALTEHGVTDPLLMDAALDRLEKTGQMFRDEDGKVKFKGVDKYGIDTIYDPKVGLKSWVQTEGKSFVPAVDAGGSGTGGARNGGKTNTDNSKLSPQQRAAIEIDRASQGLPPLDA